MHNPHGLTAIPAESQRWDRLTQAKWKVESHFQVFMYFFFLSTMAYTNTYNIRTVQTVSVLYSWIDYDKICSILFCFFFVHIFHRHRLFGVWAKCYTIHLLLARRWTFFFLWIMAEWRTYGAKMLPEIIAYLVVCIYFPALFPRNLGG